VIRVSQRNFLLALVAAAAPTQPAWAVSRKVAEIFRKDNRELPPPPKSLRASAADPDERFKAGVSRLTDKPAAASTPKASVVKKNEEDDDAPETVSVKAPSVDESTWSTLPKASATESARPSLRRARPHRDYVSFDGRRTFGIGFMGAGAYGVFGAEVDFGLNEQWTAGFGLGTGMSYNTWGAHARYFIQTAKWSPLIEGGFARWNMGKVPVDGESVIPNHISQRFFADSNGVIPSPRAIYILYPGVGVLYQHRSGLAALLELQYFIHASNFAGGLFGTTGVYYYF
jgi:hypothetical protein